MTNSVFNNTAYLQLEAERQGGQCEMFDLGDGMTAKFISRQIKGSAARDLVSVYGYPDFALSTPHRHCIDVNSILVPLADTARRRKLIAAYLRCGLTQEVKTSDETIAGCDAIKVTVGEVVVVDVTNGPQTAVQSYRKQLRNELRRPNGLAIKRSDDYNAFHKIYTQNMKRVNAQKSYYFSPSYLRSLGAIAGVELWLAKDEHDIVAGGVFIRHGDLVFYHLGATADNALAVSPMKHLLHHRIQALASAGDTRWLVLGGGVGGNEDPLFRFKRGFSKLTQPVHALRIVFDRRAYRDLSGPESLPISASGFFPAFRAPN